MSEDEVEAAFNVVVKGLVKIITDAQDVLAEYIVPDSGVSDAECVNRLLGVLDNQDNVRFVRSTLADPIPEAPADEEVEGLAQALRNLAEGAEQEDRVILYKAAAALRRPTETDKPGVREAALEEAAKVADMFAADHAKSADQFGIDRNRELHNAAKGAAQGVAFAIRALSAPLAAEQPVADRDGSGRYLDWNDPADAIAPLPRSTTGGAK